MSSALSTNLPNSGKVYCGHVLLQVSQNLAIYQSIWRPPNRMGLNPEIEPVELCSASDSECSWKALTCFICVFGIWGKLPQHLSCFYRPELPQVSLSFFYSSHYWDTLSRVLPREWTRTLSDHQSQPKNPDRDYFDCDLRVHWLGYIWIRYHL